MNDLHRQIVHPRREMNERRSEMIHPSGAPNDVSDGKIESRQPFGGILQSKSIMPKGLIETIKLFNFLRV